MNGATNIIPTQYTGTQSGSKATHHAASAHQANTLFNEAKFRLLNINRWKKICGDSGAEFQLTNEHGAPVYSAIPEVGNLIRIHLPAPPHPHGDGFDWVRIETFERRIDLAKDEEVYGFRVRPVASPLNHSARSAHFYTSEATSTFILFRRASTVHAMEIGRNELPNSEGGFFDRMRNLGIAFLAMLGLSKPQWQRLMEGILNPKIK